MRHIIEMHMITIMIDSGINQNFIDKGLMDERILVAEYFDGSDVSMVYGFVITFNEYWRSFSL